MDCYKVLRVRHDATNNEIEEAFQKLASIWNPEDFDVYRDIALGVMQDINHARDYLLSPKTSEIKDGGAISGKEIEGSEKIEFSSYSGFCGTYVEPWNVTRISQDSNGDEIREIDQKCQPVKDKKNISIIDQSSKDYHFVRPSSESSISETDEDEKNLINLNILKETESRNLQDKTFNIDEKSKNNFDRKILHKSFSLTSTSKDGLSNSKKASSASELKYLKAKAIEEANDACQSKKSVEKIFNETRKNPSRPKKIDITYLASKSSGAKEADDVTKNIVIERTKSISSKSEVDDACQDTEFGKTKSISSGSEEVDEVYQNIEFGKTKSTPRESDSANDEYQNIEISKTKLTPQASEKVDYDDQTINFRKAKPTLRESRKFDNVYQNIEFGKTKSTPHETEKVDGTYQNIENGKTKSISSEPTGIHDAYQDTKYENAKSIKEYENESENENKQNILTSTPLRENLSLPKFTSKREFNNSTAKKKLEDSILSKDEIMNQKHTNCIKNIQKMELTDSEETILSYSLHQKPLYAIQYSLRIPMCPVRKFKSDSQVSMKQSILPDLRPKSKSESSIKTIKGTFKKHLTSETDTETKGHEDTTLESKKAVEDADGEVLEHDTDLPKKDSKLSACANLCFNVMVSLDDPCTTGDDSPKNGATKTQFKSLNEDLYQLTNSEMAGLSNDDDVISIDANRVKSLQMQDGKTLKCRSLIRTTVPTDNEDYADFWHGKVIASCFKEESSNVLRITMILEEFEFETVYESNDKFTETIEVFADGELRFKIKDVETGEILKPNETKNFSSTPITMVLMIKIKDKMSTLKKVINSTTDKFFVLIEGSLEESYQNSN